MRNRIEDIVVVVVRFTLTKIPLIDSDTIILKAVVDPFHFFSILIRVVLGSTIGFWI